MTIGILRGRAEADRLRRGIAAAVMRVTAGAALGLLAVAELHQASASIRTVLWSPAACPMGGSGGRLHAHAGNPVARPAADGFASLPIGVEFFGATTATTTFMAASTEATGRGFDLDVTALAYLGLTSASALVLGTMIVPWLPSTRATSRRSMPAAPPSPNPR